MKRRGGSLDKSPAFYIVCVIAILNIIAYISVRDWQSIAFFGIAGLVTYAFDTNKTLVLIVAIIAATLFRITRSQREGMAKKKLPVAHENKDLNPIQQLKEAMSGANLEGLHQQTDKLMKNQKQMFHMAKNLQPMMKQATEMMKNLPEGFLEKAMKNFN